MFRIAIFILILFAVAIGFAWLADNPGSVTVKWPWAQAIVEISLMQAMIAVATVVALIMASWWVIAGIINSPKSFGRWRSGRRRDKGYNSLSRGLVAAGAGNAPLARKLTKESAKLLDNEPLVAMLDAQTALLEGNRGVARKKFEAMLENDETRLLGLRGLYVEAEQEGIAEAAAHFATEANKNTPGTPWAAQAVLKAQTRTGEWDEAIRTLELNRTSGLYEKEEYNRKKAVLLTAQAMAEEDASPDKAKAHALAAHKLAPGLVPAAVVAARVSSRLNDMRKAAKVLEASWKLEPHPEIAEAYIHLRSGDSVLDRLKRAEALDQKRPNHAEGQFAIAHAAIDAGEWNRARDAMQAALRTSQTERACLMMADIEEAEHGDRGRVREWLARAVNAPKDAAWTADGVVSETWAPYSPVTGRLDAFEWKVPVEQIGGPAISEAKAADYSQLAHEPLPQEPIADEPLANIVEDEEEDEIPTIEIVSTTAAATVVAAVAENQNNEKENEAPDDIVDAEIVEQEDDKDEAVSPVSDKPATEDVKVTDETPDEKKPNPESSPYKNTNFDEDEDGVIDHRPDDPGVTEKKKITGNLF